MRGKLFSPYLGLAVVGITPADAGKTSIKVCINCFFQDHPRGCGENFIQFKKFVKSSGSPPRMRGKRANQLMIIAGFRITPADAGKTTGQKATQWRLEDHPRGCGEN